MRLALLLFKGYSKVGPIRYYGVGETDYKLKVLQSLARVKLYKIPDFW
jgi:hypothetical protein